MEPKTTFGLVVGVPLRVLLICLEGERQARIFGPPSARPNLAGAGFLEFQKHLQADRRVDTLVEQVRDEAVETEQDAGGRGAEAGGGRGARVSPLSTGSGILRGEAAKLAGGSRVPARTPGFLSRRPASVLRCVSVCPETPDTRPETKHG